MQLNVYGGEHDGRKATTNEPPMSMRVGSRGHPLGYQRSCRLILQVVREAFVSYQGVRVVRSGNGVQDTCHL